MSSQKEIFPDFLVIGAGKSGTTSLDNYLRQHPEIFMCPVKEPNFFAYEKHKVSDFTLQEDIYHYEHSVTQLDDYLELFRDSERFKVRGEVSNTYLYGKYSIETIKKYVPEAKLIAIFRQPAERLYSRYLHLARENQLPTENFEDAFDRETIWWQRPDLVREGFYFKNLSPFYEQFDPRKIKILFYEDLKKNVEGLLREIFTFLEVDPAFTPDNTHVVFNQSGHIKNKAVHRLIGANGMIINTLKKISPAVIRQAKKIDFIQHGLIKMRSRNLERPPLSPEMKERLTREIYQEDIQKLEKLIQKDLKHWYTF